MKEYSTDISEAFEVMEKVLDSGFELNCLSKQDRVCDGLWVCDFHSTNQKVYQSMGCFGGFATGKTAAEAICKAALKCFTHKTNG